MRIAGFVNAGTSTSFQLELSNAVNRYTNAEVTVVSFYDDSVDDMDEDVAAFDIEFLCLGADSRFDVSAYRRLREVLPEYDILHTHYNAVGSFGRLSSLGHDITIVNTEHNDHQYFSHLQNVTNAASYPLIDAYITNSDSTRQSLQWYERPLLWRSQVETIYNGIDMKRIADARKRSDIPSLPVGLRIVTAATLTNQKNLEPLIRSMRLVRQRHPEAHLVVVGDGPKRDALERTAHRAGVSDMVTFLGYLPEREQVYAVLDRCDIFAVTSHYEGFCNAAVEAMACELPVVASDIAVLREVVGDGGRFVDQTEPTNIASALMSLLSNPEERTKVGETGAERARRKFSLEQCAREYYRLYQNLSWD